MQHVSVIYFFFVVFYCSFFEFVANEKISESTCKDNTCNEKINVCRVPDTSDKMCLYEFYSFFCHSIIRFDNPKIHSHLGCLREGLQVDNSHKCDETPMKIPELSACDKEPIEESFENLYFNDEFVYYTFFDQNINAEEVCSNELRVFNHNAEHETNENFVKIFKKYEHVFSLLIIREFDQEGFRNLCIEQLYNLTEKNIKAY